MAEATPDPKSSAESERLAALDSYGILDTPAETGYDDIVLLASQICAAPVALVSLVTGHRQWFKARIGFDLRETPLDQSICRHAVACPGILIIPDLTADPRTRNNTLVTSVPHLRFYAGARLETPEGVPLGTLCVIDFKARPEGLGPSQVVGLEALARQVMAQMELRRTAAARDDAMRALREEQAHHRQIVESAVDFAIIAMDREGRVTDWNAGAEQIFGWSAEQMQGEPADCFFTPEDRANDQVGCEMRRALQAGRADDERWHLRNDGSRFWANGEMMPRRDDEGRHVGFIKIVRDETLRHDAVENLRVSEEFLQSVLASSDDCIQVLDFDANLVFMSEGGQRAMEVADFETLRGRPWPVTCPDELRETARKAVQAAKAGGTGHYQGPTDTFAGKPKWWDVRVTPILDGQGQPVKLLAISRDITATCEADAALREAHGLNSLILNSSGDCTVVLDLDGRTQYVSPGGIQAMEIADLGAVIGQPWLRVWKGADLEAARNAVAAARAGGAGQFQGYCPTHKGTPKWWDVAISPLTGADGSPERLVSVGRDITASRQIGERLMQSQERLNLALGASGMVGIWDWDLKTGSIYADANFARMHDVDPGRAANGAPLADYIRTFHPDDKPVFQRELDRLYSGAQEFTNEYRLLQPDGSVRWLLAKGRMVRDADAVPSRFPGAVVDITERKEADERRLAILTIGDRLRDMDDPMAMAFTAAQVMGRALGASRAGYGTVDPTGDAIVVERDWTAPGIQSLAGTHMFRDFGSFGEDLKRAQTVVIADTEQDPRTAQCSASLIAVDVRAVINHPVFEHGRFVALFFVNVATRRDWTAEQVAFVQNIADRTRAAIERRHAETRLRQLNDDLERRVQERTRERDRVWRNSQDLLVVLDRQGVFQSVSPVSSTILGWSPEEMVGLTVFDFIHSDDLPTAGSALRKSKGEVLPTYLNRYRRKDGTYRWMSWVVAPENEWVYAYGRDVTAEKEKSEALHLAEEQLRQAQKMEAVGQLTGGVAHDFNNLLTIIRSSVDLLKRPNLKEERRLRYVEAISDTTARASKLTGQLLAFARRQALKPEVFDVVKSVATIHDMVGTLTGSRIRIETSVPDHACFVCADPNQFDTALVNLAVNARDAMNGDGQLTIAIRISESVRLTRSHHAIPGAFVAVSMSDTGSGIPADDLERIFEPFFTTKAVGFGTGLGLSQVFGFVKQSGGEVVVESEIGQGSTFTLYLPRSSPPNQAAPPDVAPESLVDGHGIRVLIVEDNEDVGTFATQTLQELGFETVLAIDGEDALAKLTTETRQFDVVFSDVMMPGMNGIELGQEIRRRYPHLPVVLTSGYSHVLAQNGTYGFELLHKPYSVEDMSRVLRKAAGWRSRLIAKTSAS